MYTRVLNLRPTEYILRDMIDAPAKFRYPDHVFFQFVESVFKKKLVLTPTGIGPELKELDKAETY